MSNTDCSRILQGCRAKSCVLQSPNFPGFYPRNVTCYYLVKALPAPSPHFKPVIALGQPNNRLIHVGDHDLLSRISPEVSLLKNCPGDHISVYDGGEMKAPLLARFCGSTSLPNITSSGPEMLVVFHSASAGRMNHPPNMVVGFELLARVLFRKRRVESGCSYEITSFEVKHGTIHSPPYSMPSNSSCVYQFYANRDEVIWLYFSKYYRKRKFDANYYNSECRNGLTIEESLTGNPEFSDESIQTVGQFCDETSPPVCIRSKQKHRLTAPCTQQESFLSTKPRVRIEQKFTDGTSLMPLQYILHYEYVTIDKGGQNDCGQVYSSKKRLKGSLSSPKNVFKFGRGGKTSMNCSHTFHIGENETLTIKITKLNLLNDYCKSYYNYHYDAHRCLKTYTNSAVLMLSEETFEGVVTEAQCLCDNTSIPQFTSHAAKLNLIFTVRNMTWSNDQYDFLFEAEYKYQRAKQCVHDRNISGNSGIISLGNSSSSKLCDLLPWTIYGNTKQYLYLNVPGSHPSSSSCNTNNRIVIFFDGKPVKSICPNLSDEDGSVSVFSPGWKERGPWHQSQFIFFRYIKREPGNYIITWLEITRDPQPPVLESVSVGGGPRQTSPGSCESECPELMACINSSLWCDGYRHCPSGADEHNCYPSRLAWAQTLVLFGSGTALTVVAITVLGITATHVVRQDKIKRRKKKHAQQIMTQDVLLPLAHKNDSYYMS